MADWFDFKGVRSTTYGVYVQDPPPATIPEERATFEPIPGRSGSLTLREGDAVYNDVVLSVNCFVRDLTQLDAIATWLRGSGDLVLGSMPDRYYKARCVNQIELAKVLRGRQHRTFAAVFRCQPYRYQYPAPTDIPYMSMTNMITNGDFSDGTTGWSYVSATITTESGRVKVIATASGGRLLKTITVTSGHQYYLAADVQAYDPARIRLRGVAGTSDVRVYPTTTDSEHLSLVVTADGTSLTVRLDDTGTSGWDYYYGDNFILVDLTSAFGAGNEPTATEMDDILNNSFSDVWFDGTAVGDIIVNPGTVEAFALVTVVGSGDVELTLGDYTINIEDLASSITIDCETGISVNGATDLTPTVSMDYPVTLPPGTTEISWTGTVTSVTIAPAWRYI